MKCFFLLTITSDVMLYIEVFKPSTKKNI